MPVRHKIYWLLCNFHCNICNSRSISWLCCFCLCCSLIIIRNTSAVSLWLVSVAVGTVVESSESDEIIRGTGLNRPPSMYGSFSSIVSSFNSCVVEWFEWVDSCEGRRLITGFELHCLCIWSLGVSSITLMAGCLIQSTFMFVFGTKFRTSEFELDHPGSYCHRANFTDGALPRWALFEWWVARWCICIASWRIVLNIYSNALYVRFSDSLVVTLDFNSRHGRICQWAAATDWTACWWVFERLQSDKTRLSWKTKKIYTLMTIASHPHCPPCHPCVWSSCCASQRATWKSLRCSSPICLSVSLSCCYFAHRVQWNAT